MKNLDQIRAANALEAASGTKYRGAANGEVVKKVPTMIRENGILGALAFAIENDGKSGHADVFRAVIHHLVDVRTPMSHASLSHESSPQELMKHLAAADAATLRAVTAESLAYLNYLRRFARKNKGEG